MPSNSPSLRNSRWLRRTTISSLALTGTLLFGFTAVSAQAQAPTNVEGQTLVADDLASLAELGDAVAIDGDTLIVGAPSPDRAEEGAAYIFTRDAAGEWANPQRITAGDAGGGDLFGTAVAIDGDTIIVGASGDRDFGFGSGSAYVFTRTGTSWTEQAKLNAIDGRSSDSFGVSVAISGDTIAIGAIGRDDVYTGPLVDPMTQEPVLDANGDPVLGLLVDQADIGSVHIFSRTGTSWTQQQEVVASDFAASDQFGSAIAIDGDTLAVGVRQDDTAAGNDAGSAYVFTRTGTDWTQQQQLFFADEAQFDFFGDSIAIDGNTIAVGVPGEDPGGVTASGAVAIFTGAGDNWTQSQELTAPAPALNDQFGFSLDIEGTSIIVGAPSNLQGATNTGAAYVYTSAAGVWSLDQELVPSQPVASDEFANAVAISGGTALVGAPAIDTAFVYADGLDVAPPPPPEPVVPTCNGLEVTVNLALGDVPTAGDDVILGTDGPDVIEAGDGADVICGGDGDDIIRAGKGGDWIDAGAGDDTVAGGKGHDTINGGEGNDDLRGDKGRDTINGGEGNDDLRGDEGQDTINGGEGNDVLRGGTKADVLNGDAGDDNLGGGKGTDILDGGIGIDEFNGGGGTDSCTVDPNGLTEIVAKCEN